MKEKEVEFIIAKLQKNVKRLFDQIIPLIILIIIMMIIIWVQNKQLKQCQVKCQPVELIKKGDKK